MFPSHAIEQKEFAMPLVPARRQFQIPLELWCAILNTCDLVTQVNYCMACKDFQDITKNQTLAIYHAQEIASIALKRGLYGLLAWKGLNRLPDNFKSVIAEKLQKKLQKVICQHILPMGIDNPNIPNCRLLKIDGHDYAQIIEQVSKLDITQQEKKEAICELSLPWPLPPQAFDIEPSMIAPLALAIDTLNIDALTICTLLPPSEATDPFTAACETFDDAFALNLISKLPKLRFKHLYLLGSFGKATSENIQTSIPALLSKDAHFCSIITSKL